MLNWLIGQDADPSTAPFEIYDSATLRQYMEGDFSQPVECTCIEGCDEARTTAGTLNTEDSVCYEISGSINGWNAWDLGNRTIQVNGTTVSSGESLPAQIEGKYYFYFSAGTPSWNGWTYW
jgi:hypothetical protein